MFKFNKYAVSALKKSGLCTKQPAFLFPWRVKKVYQVRNFHYHRPSFNVNEEEKEYYDDYYEDYSKYDSEQFRQMGSEDNPICVTYSKRYFFRRTIVASILLGVVLFTYLIITHDENVYKQLLGINGGGGGGAGPRGGGLSNISRSIIGEKPIPIKKTDITFKDVKGIDESKEELVEIVEFLKDPKKFERLGGKIPKGVLLHGKTGTGKTLLAKAVAGESNVPFFYTCGSSFEEGVGSKRIRELFSQAKKYAPCIIFIDEIDSIGGRRRGLDPKWSRQGLNQLLNEMDGFSPTESARGIVVIAATNFIKSLDPAILRPGRFDKIVYVPVPDRKGRWEMLKLFFQKIPIAKDVDLSAVARGLIGLTGADLANIANQSAIRASRLNRDEVKSEDIDFAVDRQLMGIERKSRAVLEKDLYQVAVHEVGHAIVNYIQNNALSEVRKITVVPRGDALGYTSLLPKEDKTELQRSKSELLASISVSLGGRVAEEIFFGDDAVSGGASADLRHATAVAREMVQRLGMSKQMGIINYEKREELAEATKREIDLEIRRIVAEAEKITREVIKGNKKKIENVAKVLMEYETITGKEFVELMKTGKIKRKKGDLLDF